MSERRFSAVEILRREWVIIAVAVVVGVIVAFLLSNRATTTQWSATRQLVVLGMAGGPSNPPAPKDFLSAATLGVVKRSAEESVGLEPGSLDGKVSVAIDGDDKRIVTFTAAAATEDLARAGVEAVSEASIDYIYDRYQLYVAVQKETIAEMSRRSSDMTARADRLEALAGSAPSAERASFEAAAIAARNEAYEAEDESRRARQAMTQLYDSVVRRETSARASSTGGTQIAALLQGVLLGLVAGIAVAATREWLLGRRDEAA